MPSTISKIPIILTRYLYNKSNVILSLQTSIKSNEYNDSLFWAYELYYSGFEEEVKQIIYEIYENIYTKYPKLGEFIKKKYNNFHETTIATVIKNMCTKNPDSIEQCNQKYIIVTNDQIDIYKTVIPTNIKWNFLRTVCKKPVFCKKMTKLQENKLLLVFREKWLFHSAGSAIWEKRIFEFGGKINKRNKTVIFSDEILEEEFYNTYNYEPDEQSLIIQKNCMGIM